MTIRPNCREFESPKCVSIIIQFWRQNWWFKCWNKQFLGTSIFRLGTWGNIFLATLNHHLKKQTEYEVCRWEDDTFNWNPSVKQKSFRTQSRHIIQSYKQNKETNIIRFIGSLFMDKTESELVCKQLNFKRIFFVFIKRLIIFFVAFRFDFDDVVFLKRVIHI